MEELEEIRDNTHDSMKQRYPPSGGATEEPSTPNLRGSLLDLGLYEVNIGSGQVTSGESVTSTRFGSLGSGTQVCAMLFIFYIALLAFGKWVFRRISTATTVEIRKLSLSKKGTGSDRTSPGSLGQEELGSGHLYDLENPASSADLRADFKAVRYAEPVPIRRGVRTSTWSRKKQVWGRKLSKASRYYRGGNDIEAGENVSSFPPSIDEVLQRSVRGFRESWWTPSDTDEDNVRDDVANASLGDIEGCSVHPETQAFLNDHVLSRSSSSGRICPAPEDICHLASPSTASAGRISGFEETDDDRADSIIPGITGESPPATVSSLPEAMPHRKFETLSLVSEELVLQAGSERSWHGDIFDSREVVMETVQLVEEAPQGAYETKTDEDGSPLPIRSDAQSLPEESREEGGEEKENNPLLQVSPVVQPHVQDLAEPLSFATRLGAILRGVQNIPMALRENYLARYCSLSNSEENSDLQRDRVLGEGKYGRVSLVWHEEFGPFAMKELTEEARPEDRAVAMNEMETFLCVGDNENIVRVFAMDSTLPTRPIMMEAGCGDMFDIVVNDAMSMQTKIRLLHGAACGLVHMHAKGKVHRDIKPGNIVVVGGPVEETLQAKVADFGLTCDAGMTTPPTTGTAGFIPVENLRREIDAGPDADVFSFAVVMLIAFVLPEHRMNNVFAHPNLHTCEEKIEMEHFRAVGDAGALFELECRIMERTIDDVSFQEFMLVPEKLKDSVPDKEEVLFFLSCSLSPDREMRPTMREVADMLQKLMA